MIIHLFSFEGEAPQKAIFHVYGCVILFCIFYFHQLRNLKKSICKILLLLIAVVLWLLNPSSVTMFDRNTMQK